MPHKSAPPTTAAAKRKLTITLELKPDDDRKTITVSCTAKSTLAPTNPVVTSLYVADEENVVEMVPQIHGQFGFDGMVVSVSFHNFINT